MTYIPVDKAVRCQITVTGIDITNIATKQNLITVPTGRIIQLHQIDIYDPTGSMTGAQVQFGTDTNASNMIAAQSVGSTGTTNSFRIIPAAGLLLKLTGGLVFGCKFTVAGASGTCTMDLIGRYLS